MAVLGVAAAFDGDVGMRLEQADQRLAGRLADQYPPLALHGDARDQRPMVMNLDLPQCDNGPLAASAANATRLWIWQTPQDRLRVAGLLIRRRVNVVFRLHDRAYGGVVQFRTARCGNIRFGLREKDVDQRLGGHLLR